MERREFLRQSLAGVLVGATALALPLGAIASSVKEKDIPYPHERMNLFSLSMDPKESSRYGKWLGEDELQVRYGDDVELLTIKRFRQNGKYKYAVTSPRKAPSPNALGTVWEVEPGVDYRKVRKDLLEVIHRHKRWLAS